MFTPFTDILNLDSNFDPVRYTFGGQELYRHIADRFTFPAGEPHLQIMDMRSSAIGEKLVITQRYNGIKDFFDILLAVDAAKRLGYKRISLILPYFPGARQDRVCNIGEPLTAKVFADLLNGCGFEEVVIHCPHSEVTPALLNNCIVPNRDLEYVEQTLAHMSNKFGEKDYNKHVVNIVIPDAGAAKRVGKIAEFLQMKFGNWGRVELIRCEKVRDVSNGQIKEFFVHAEDLGGYPTVIIDDTCAKGGTFLGLAKVLKQKNCGPLGIQLGHVDFQEGLDNLEKEFDIVCVSNSKQDWIETDVVKVYNLEYNSMR